MSTLSYNALPEWEQDLIDDARTIMGDIDPDPEDRMFTDQQWASILLTTVRDFDRTRPPTSFGAENFPQNFAAVLELGLLYHGALTRSNHLIEDIPISGFQGPYADTSVLSQRWSARANDLKPHWIHTRNLSKLEFLPKPAGTVNQYSWFGQTASIIPVLRALPSWGYAR